jgi:hypothetical protein
MKTDPNETLAKFGMDPKQVLRDRKRDVGRLHDVAYEGVGRIISRLLDYCNVKGYGNASKIHVMQACTEPGLSAMAIAVTYVPDMMKSKGADIPFDSMLFASIFTAVCADCVSGGPDRKGKEMQTAHELFEKATGRSFRDCFIHTCGCTRCAERRKRHNIKYDPNADGGWI